MDRKHAYRQPGTQRLLGKWSSLLRKVLSILARKPNWGSSNPDIARYVYEKYVKRKYVKDPSIPDPLALSKRSKF